MSYPQFLFSQLESREIVGFGKIADLPAHDSLLSARARVLFMKVVSFVCRVNLGIPQHLTDSPRLFVPVFPPPPPEACFCHAPHSPHVKLSLHSLTFCLSPVLRLHIPEYLQVKTLSFLTYLLRGFTPLMQPYEQQISSSVIMLLRSCPADAVATRKELLVATRHILATDFRRGFFSEVVTAHVFVRRLLSSMMLLLRSTRGIFFW